MVIEWDEFDQEDPYGATIEAIRNALSFGFKGSGSMSEGEYENLKKIEELVRAKDNS